MRISYIAKHTDKQWKVFYDELNNHVASDTNRRPKPYYEVRDIYTPFDVEILPTLNNILIVGERGTGKELLAQEIAEVWHGNRSTPALPPQACFNCAGWSEELARSEIFGYEPGAFTGANKKGHKGLLTRFPIIFLDEIHRLPQSIQAMLLRLIEYAEYQPIGGETQVLNPTPRIIAAAQPSALVSSSSFLPDLLDRFHYRAELPTLNSTPEFICRLFVIFAYSALLRRGCSQEQIKSIKISESLLADLLSHNWHGNMRELNTVALQCHIRNGYLYYNFELESYSIELKSAAYKELEFAHRKRPRRRIQHHDDFTTPFWKDVSQTSRDYIIRMRKSDEVWYQIFRSELVHREVGLSLLDVWNLPPFDLCMASLRGREDIFLKLNNPEAHRQKWADHEQQQTSPPKLRGKALHDKIKATLKETNGNVSQTALICRCSPKTVRDHRNV